MSPIEDYLARLRAGMKGNPLLARRVIEEVRDHLWTAADEEKKRGLSDHEAEVHAVRRFGSPEPFARKFDRYSLPFRALLLFMSLASVGVGLWLVFVITAVLPSRDPAHIPLWRGITAGFLTYSGLTWAYLLRGPRLVWLRWVVTSTSLAAVALGIYAIVDMLTVAASGGHFEGYMVLMGFIVAGHGLSALFYTVWTQRIARSIGA